MIKYKVRIFFMNHGLKHCLIFSTGLDYKVFYTNNLEVSINGYLKERYKEIDMPFGITIEDFSYEII